jgi:hypothetical protein
VARDPKHLGAEIGFFVLYLSQKLTAPHYCVVQAGGLSADRTRWIKPRYDFFLPVEVLGHIFRGKFQALKRASCGKLTFLETKAPRPAENLCCGSTNVPKGLGGLRETPEVQSMCPLSAVTPIAWPSPTIDWSRLLMGSSRFVGAIPHTATNRS